MWVVSVWNMPTVEHALHATQVLNFGTLTVGVLNIYKWDDCGNHHQCRRPIIRTHFVSFFSWNDMNCSLLEMSISPSVRLSVDISDLYISSTTTGRLFWNFTGWYKTLVCAVAQSLIFRLPIIWLKTEVQIWKYWTVMASLVLNIWIWILRGW